MRKRYKLYKCIGTLIALGLMVSAVLPVQAAVTQEDLAKPVVDKSTHNLEGPKHSYWGEHKTVYHYVYFGNYPQREIKGEELTSAIINAEYDQYGNGVVDGKQIRRLSEELITTYGTINDSTYLFKKQSANGYRYFLYEPIKWRIYSNDGSRLFLVADKAIEQQMYTDHMSEEVRWAECDLRRWLNYEGGEPNVDVGMGYQYKNPGFLYYAFSEEEKKRIEVTHVKQDCNPVYTDGDGNPMSSGEDTEDKIFIPSYSEMANLDYGNCDDCGHGCQAAYFCNTDYSAVMNKDLASNKKAAGYIWLRTVGSPPRDDFLHCDPNVMATYSSGVYQTGMTHYIGLVPYDDVTYVVPALNTSYTLADCIRVSFQTNAEVTVEDQILLGSNYATEPEEIAKGNYKFSGWYLDKERTMPYLFNRKLTQDTTLYGGWKQDVPVGLTGGIMKIYGTTSSMEYTTSNQNDARWVSCENGATTVPMAGKYYVRYKQTDQLMAGEAVEVQVSSVDEAVAEYIKEKNIPKSTAAITDKAIVNVRSDSDIKGSSFGLLQAAAEKTTKTTVKLKWNKLDEADGYEIYGAECNTKKKKNRYKLIKTITNKNTNIYTQKKRKKGTYYKYIVRAYKEIEGQKLSIAVSKTIHAATTGGRYGNAGKIKVSKSTVSLKKGKKYTLKTREVVQSKKIQKHRAVAYESDNTKIATVSQKGVIKGKKKGSCNIYVYAQNGVYKKIKVKIK